MISIIIVNYNSGDFLQKCIQSLMHSINIMYEVIVVDNNSTDDSIDLCRSNNNNKRISYILLKENLGFAKANNIGAHEAKGDILHFLNPDTLIDKSMNKDYKVVEDQPNFIYVNRLQNLDGSLMRSKHLIPTVPNYIKSIIPFFRAGYWYTGATVIISKNNFNKIGCWNENYFMYAEDLDLFYKSYLNGIQDKMLDSVIIHVGGASSSKVWTSFQRDQRVEKSIKKFYRLNGITWQYHIVSGVMLLRLLFINPARVFYMLKVLKSI